MKTRLSQLTLAQFVDLECGELDVLKERHEVVPMERLIETRCAIATEFHAIASPASYKSMLVSREKKSKLRAKAILFSGLKSLVDIDALTEVRELMMSAGIDCGGFDDKRLRSEVEQLLNSVTFELKRMGLDAPKSADVSPDDIRRGYEDMVADLMIINRMNIDMESIRASVFASMINKANEMAKALNEKVNKSKR